MTTAKPEFKKYWQVNTLKKPEKTTDGVILRNSDFGLNGKVSVRMLRPKADKYQMEILSDETAYSVFGQKFTPPFPAKPEANGHRVMFSPKTKQASDIFLAVMPLSDDKAPELPVTLDEGPTIFTLTIANRIVVLSKSGKLLEQSFQLDVKADQNSQLLLAGLAPGNWSIRSQDGRVKFNTKIETGRNTAFFVVPCGSFTVQPESISGAPEFQAAPDFMPTPAPAIQ